MKSGMYTSVIILFNPNSTGPSQENAQDVKRELEAKAGKSLKVQLIETQHAGHAEELAEKYSKSKDALLLVSSSGDGGYHELINGVMNAKKHAGKLVVSLIPSGNANDHYNATKSTSYIDSVVQKNVRTMDLIKLTSTIDGKPWTRYGHSYVGFGISAHVGKRLTDADLNIINEKYIVLKGLFDFRYIKISRKGKNVKYSSLIFSNISRMSKVLKLAEKSKLSDGKMEVSEIKYTNILVTILNLIRMMFVDISQQQSVEDYKFMTTKKTPVQVDGETYLLDADVDVRLSVVKKAIDFVS